MQVQEEINGEYLASQAKIKNQQPIAVGDMVLVRWDPYSGKPQKLSPKNHGPYEIVDMEESWATLKTISGFDKVFVIHMSRLVPFCWDERSNRSIMDEYNAQERTSIVIAIREFTGTTPENLEFSVEFTDGVFTHIPLANLVQILFSKSGWQPRRELLFESLWASVFVRRNRRKSAILFTTSGEKSLR